MTTADMHAESMPGDDDVEPLSSRMPDADPSTLAAIVVTCELEEQQRAACVGLGDAEGRADHARGAAVQATELSFTES